MERRLSLLYHQAYIDWPSGEQRKEFAIPESVVWLGWRGILQVAGAMGVQIEAPKNENENQMRLLERRLRDKGIRWIRIPRWSILSHDLAVLDFRILVENSVAGEESIYLEEWINESVFRSDPDRVAFSFEDKRGNRKRVERGVIPDSYFVIVNEMRLRQGLPARARFLLEYDMGTHETFRFAVEKALAGAAYLKSRAYKDRFGHNSGRWLIITSGQTRMTHLMNKLVRILGSEVGLFMFTTQDQLGTDNILSSPMWRVPGEQNKSVLLEL